MLRKIAFLVPAFALALLAVSRFSGFAGKIGSDGLVWAQDSPIDNGDQNTADASSTMKFNGSGTLDATPSTPCSHVNCYSLTGMVTKTSVKGLAPGDIAGDFILDSCKTNPHTRTQCCTFSSSETYSFSDGDLDVMLSGMACGKNPKHVTAKLPYEIMGGTGTFSSASGSGKAKITFNTDTLTATFSFKGNLTE